MFQEVGRQLQRWSQRLVNAYARLSVVYKLALTSWLVLVVGTVLLLLVVVNYQRQLLNIQIESLGNIIASQFAASVTEPLFTGDSMALEVLTVNLVKDPRVRAARIVDHKGEVVVRVGHFVAPAAYTPAPHPAGQVIVAKGAVVVTSPVVFNEVSAGEVVVEFITLDVRRSFEWMLQTIVSVALAMMLILMLCAFVFSRHLSRPITSLVEATEKIGAGDYDIEVPSGREDEIGRLADAVQQMATGLQHKRRVESLLNRVVAADVAKALLMDTGAVNGGSEKVEVSVLFVDIVGFTAMTERHSPDEIVTLLNEYFGYFTLCSQLFFGTVDKFIGDCAMIIFGAPRHSNDHRFQALGCAVAIQRLLEELNRRRRDTGHEHIRVRIGINSGEVMAGTVGAQQRMEYTVIGDTVNLASRLTALAEPGSILVGEATIQHPSLAGRAIYRSLGEFSVKGKLAMTRAVEVINIAPDYANIIDNLIEDILH